MICYWKKSLVRSAPDLLEGARMFTPSIRVSVVAQSWHARPPNQPLEGKKNHLLTLTRKQKLTRFIIYPRLQKERDRVCVKSVCMYDWVRVCVCIWRVVKNLWDEINALPWALLNHHLLRKNNLHLSYFIFHFGGFLLGFRKYSEWVPPVFCADRNSALNRSN